MRVKLCLLCFLLFACGESYSQKKSPAIMDTTIYDYDEIFSELDALLDSIYTPRSFAVANISAGNGFFKYTTATATETKQQVILSPSVSFFEKSGFGASAGASLVNDGTGLKPFQYLLTGSFDYLKQKAFISGLSLTHYFTKSNLPFYTSPLKNEMYGYFMYRNHWLKPSLSVSYGWGSREAVEEQETIIEKIKKNQNNGNGNGGNGNGNGNGGTGTPVTNIITTNEAVADFTVSASVRRDFYFLNALSKKDYIRVTPQLSFASGTQQFGFNTLTTSYSLNKRTGKNVITGTQNLTLDDGLTFQPLSLTAQLRTEYSKGKFFIQPQVFFDYYFPATSGNFTTAFLVNAGVIF